MIGRLLLVGLFFIGMINGRPQRRYPSLQDHLDKAIDGLLELKEQTDKNEMTRAERHCFPKTTTLFYCINCLKQRVSADNVYSEETQCKEAGYSERPFTRFTRLNEDEKKKEEEAEFSAWWYSQKDGKR